MKLNFAKRNAPDSNYKLSSLKVNMEYCTISDKKFWNSARSKPRAPCLKNQTKCDKVFHIVKQKRLFMSCGRQICCRKGRKGRKTVSTSVNMEDKNPIQVAGRLFGALEYLAVHGETGLMELASVLELNKTTAHRVVSSLQYMGYVRQNSDSGKYEVTLKLVDLADHVTGRLDIVSAARPYLQHLVELTGETVHLVQLEGSDVVYIDKVESQAATIRMVSRIGSRIPFYRSAVGKAIAARLTEPEVRELWGACVIERTTPYTITNYEDFLETLEEVRRKGYALDNEENETGVRCIGASLDFGGTHPKYAFSISVPIGRMDNDRIRELSGYILKTKDEIERGFRGAAGRALS